MNGEKVKSAALYGVCAAAAAGALWLGLRFALPILLPFFLAYVLSCAVRPAAAFLEKKTGLTRKAWAVAVITASAAGAVSFLWFGVAAFVREARDALTGIARVLSQPDGPLDAVKRFVSEIGERFGSGEELTAALGQMASSAAASVSSGLTELAGKFLAGLPSFLFALAVGLVALFYFSLSYEESSRAVMNIVPHRVKDGTLQCVSAVMRGLGRFVRAYMLIMLLTFAELLAGFVLLSVEHAALWALLTAVIDVLPVFGVGTVLVPWALIAFLEGDSFRGLGLLILLAVMWGVRQPVEAKLVGKSAGVHPVLALIAVYAGFRLAGVGGMILAPLALNAWAVMWEERKKKCCRG